MQKDTSNASNAPLFRPEVIAAQGAQWMGSVRLAQPIGDRLAALGAGVVIATIVGFFAFSSYTRKATVAGVISPAHGELRVTTAVSGVVIERRVKEGQQVAAGDVLYVLSGERMSEQGETQSLIGEQLKRRHTLLESDQLQAMRRLKERTRHGEARLAAIDNELVELGKEAELLAQRERVEEASTLRFEELAKTGHVSAEQIREKQIAVLAIKTQSQSLRRVRSNLEREREGIAAQLAESRAQSQMESAEIERNLSMLSQERLENDARKRQVIKAPFAGTATSVTAQVGGVISPGQSLATLVPHNAPLQAHLYVPTRQSGFIQVGQQVRLRYSAYPYQKFGMGSGKVIEIAGSPSALQELPAHVASAIEPTATNAEPVYRVMVQLENQNITAYGKAHALKTGMLLEADVLQDKRKLYEWLLEPLYSVTGKAM